jgi:type IV pilus assembly protein PilX
MKNPRLIRVYQRGTSLLVAMIALVAMMTAGMALIRSVDSANLAATNFQFQQSAEQNIDMAINEAMMAYLQSHVNPALNVIDPRVTNPALNYWATTQPENQEGVPTALTALPTPSWGATGPVPTGWPGEQVDIPSQQLRRYFMDRLCNAPGVVTAANCQNYTWVSRNNGEGTAANRDDLTYLRITVRIDGPKGAVSYAQMFLMTP